MTIEVLHLYWWHMVLLLTSHTSFPKFVFSPSFFIKRKQKTWHPTHKTCKKNILRVKTSEKVQFYIQNHNKLCPKKISEQTKQVTMFRSRSWFGGGWNKPKNRLSLEHLKYLHNILERNTTVSENNRGLLVESLRCIAEILIWGDQNDSSVFE